MAKRALLVGIGAYESSRDGNDRSLDGPVNDVALIREVLEAYRFDRIDQLLDKAATRDAILAGLERLRDQAQANKRDHDEEDIVVFYFSGHGSKGAQGFWPGHTFQMIVPIDTASGRNRNIFDTEIDLWVREINAATPYVTLIFDSCYSGGVASVRDTEPERGVRTLPHDKRPFAEFFADPDLETQRMKAEIEVSIEALGQPESLPEAPPRGPSGWIRRPERSAVVLSGCAATELSRETASEVDGETATDATDTTDAVEKISTGLFTRHLTRLLEAQAETTGARWKDIFDDAQKQDRSKVAGAVFSTNTGQTPRREGDAPIFAPGDIRPDDVFPSHGLELERVAAVIGINAYGPGIPSLKSARPDAERVAEILREQHGYDVRRPVVNRIGNRDFGSGAMLDEGAKKQDILDLLEEIASRYDEETAVVIYFAGHGKAESDGKGGFVGYLLAHDAVTGERETWLAMRDFREGLSKIRARHLLLVLDCCYAGALSFTGHRSESFLGRPIYRSEYERFLGNPAWQVLTSASYNERALDTVGNRRDPEDPRTTHSPFAQALIEALTSDQADASRAGGGGDHIITAAELQQFIDDRMKRLHVQTPGLMPLSPGNKGQFVFFAPGWEPSPEPDPPIDLSHNPWPNPIVDNSGRERENGPIEEAADVAVEPPGERLYPYGRERAILGVLRRLVDGSGRLVAVVGGSGSGKSSLVRAGLLPLLEDPIGGLDVVRRWLEKLGLGYLLMSSEELGLLGEWIRELERVDDVEQIEPVPPITAKSPGQLVGRILADAKERLEIDLSDRLHLDLTQMSDALGGLVQAIPKELSLLLRLGVPDLLATPEELAKRMRRWADLRFLELLNGALNAEKSRRPWKILEWRVGVDHQKQLKSIREQLKTTTDRPRLLLIDRMETFFDADESRAKIFAVVKEMLADPDLRILVTLRSDGRGPLSEELGEQIDFYQPPPPGRRELRDFIEQPAAAQALGVTPTLVDEMVEEVVGAPTPLPFLALCLNQMYVKLVEGLHDAKTTGRSEAAEARELGREHFRAIGGKVVGPLVESLDDLYDTYDGKDRAILRKIFLRLTSDRSYGSPGHASQHESGAALVDSKSVLAGRRRVTRLELDFVTDPPDPDDPGEDELILEEDIDRVLKDLLRMRVLVIDGEYFEPASDSLVASWRRLGLDPRDADPSDTPWLAERAYPGLPFPVRQLVPLMREVWNGASAWSESGEPPGTLWRDEDRLGKLLAMRKDLNRFERRFVDAGEAVRLAAEAIKVVGSKQTSAAQWAIRAISKAGRDGGASWPEAEQALHDVLSASPLAVRLTATIDAEGIEIDGDGRSLVLGGQPDMETWDLEDLTRQTEKAPRRVDLEGAGATLDLEKEPVFGVQRDVTEVPPFEIHGPGQLCTNAGSVDRLVSLLFSAAAGATPLKLAGHSNQSQYLAFSGAGAMEVSLDGEWLASVSGREILLWRIRAPVPDGLAGQPLMFYVNPEGTRPVAYSDFGGFRRRGTDAISLERLAFVPDGWLVVHREGYKPLIWDLDGRSPFPVAARTRRLEKLEQGEWWCESVPGPTGSGPQVWVAEPMAPSAGDVPVSDAPTPAGETAAAAASVLTISELADDEREQIRLETPPGHWLFSSLSTDAQWLAARRSDDVPAFVVWQGGTRQSVALPEVSDGLERDSKLVLSPDGKWLAGQVDTVSGEQRPEIGPVLLWQTSQLSEPPRELVVPSRRKLYPRDIKMERLSFSPDARWLVGLTPDRKARIWDLTQPEEDPKRGWLKRKEREARVWSLAWSPDGRRLAVTAAYFRQVSVSQGGASDSSSLLLIDLPDGRVEHLQDELRHSETATALAFDHQGRRLAAGAADGTVRVWRLETPRPSRRATWKVPLKLRDHAFRQATGGGLQPRALAFSPDGERLAVALCDRLRPEGARIAVYWLATGKLIELAEGLAGPAPGASYLRALGLAVPEKKTPPWPFP